MDEQLSSFILSFVVFMGSKDIRWPSNICAFPHISQPLLQLVVAMWLLLASEKGAEVACIRQLVAGVHLLFFYSLDEILLKNHRFQMK